MMRVPHVLLGDGAALTLLLLFLMFLLTEARAELQIFASQALGSSLPLLAVLERCPALCWRHSDTVAMERHV